jgi:hypothetical protein
MPKFTSIENLKIQALQSLSGAPTNSELVELGTKTLDNRGLWEDNNFNETTLEPYLTENNLTLRTINVDGITFLPSISNSSIFQYSIDALPFVTDPNDRNEIIRLDNYYDKEQESNKYYLATEGKINYYIYPRTSGRPTPNGHIDNYQGRQYISRFDTYADVDVKNGFYLFKLNWGDGTDIEYTDEPKLLESTILLNHNYKKPGFYTISGVVYVADLNGNIGGYERFETKILLNPSQNYELSLYDYDNFATIGGISEDSVMIKSAVNLIGINPNTLNTDKSSPDIIEGVNLLDKFQLLNLLNKVSGSILDNFDELLNIEFNKYEERLAEVPEPIEEVEEEVEEVEEEQSEIGIQLISNNNNYGLPAPVGDVTEITLNSDNQSVQLNAIPEINTNDWNYEFDKWVIPNSKFNYIGFGNNRTLESQDRTPILYWKTSAENLPITTAEITAYFIRTEVTTDDEDTSSGNTGGGNMGGGNTGGENTGGGKRPGDDDVELPGDNEVDQYGGGVS